MGFIGYTVKLVFIPINNILVAALSAPCRSQSPIHKNTNLGRGHFLSKVQSSHQTAEAPESGFILNLSRLNFRNGLNPQSTEGDAYLCCLEST